MFAFVILCVQIFFIQYAFTQTISTPAVINNGIAPVYGPNMPGINPTALSAANIGVGLPGQMLTAGMPGSAFSPMGPQGLSIPAAQMSMAAAQMGMPAASMGIPAAQMGMPAANLAAGYGNPYGGVGNGDVAVTGELPVAGTAVVTGQVPLSGKVQFTGSLPAGGVVTISGQCGCGCNNGQYNPAFAPKSGYNNKPYIY